MMIGIGVFIGKNLPVPGVSVPDSSGGDGTEEHFLSLSGGSMITPSITFDRIVLTAHLKESDTTVQYAFHTASGLAYLYSGADPDYFMGSLKIDGVPTSNGVSFIVNARAVYDNTISSAITEAIYFGRRSTGVQSMSMDIWDIKIFNGDSLVAHYDMSTQTVDDQSGNGNHATLTSGTWS